MKRSKNIICFPVMTLVGLWLLVTAHMVLAQTQTATIYVSQNTPIVRYHSTDGGYQYAVDISHDIGRQNGSGPNSSSDYDVWRDQKSYPLSAIPANSIITQATLVVSMSAASDYLTYAQIRSIPNINIGSQGWLQVATGTLYFDNVQYNPTSFNLTTTEFTNVVKTAYEAGNTYFYIGIMNKDETVNAHYTDLSIYMEVKYTPPVNIIVRNSFSGGFIYVDGTDIAHKFSSPSFFSWKSGTTHSLKSFSQSVGGVSYTTSNNWTNVTTGQTYTNQNPLSITPTSDATYEAVFNAGTVSISVQNSFGGGYLHVDGSDDLHKHNSPTTFSWSVGSSHTLQADNQYYLDPANNKNYYRVFLNWTKPGDPNPDIANPLPIAVPGSSSTYTANFKKQFNVNALSATYIEPGSGGTYKVNGTNVGATWNGTFIQDGTIPIVLQAVPPSGPNWFFAQWSDGTTQNPYYLIPTDHTDLYAIFKTHLASSVPSATGSNNQRKVVRDLYGVLHAVYESGGEIWYSTSTNLGVTWPNETLVSDGAGPNFSPTIDIAIKNSPSVVQEVHIAWANGTSGDYFVRYRKKSGSSWETIEQASSSTALIAPTPAMSATPCAIGAAITNTTLPYCLANGDADYFYLAYKSSGGGWASLYFYGYNNGPVSAPSVQINASNLAFAFLDNGRISYNEVGPLCGALSSSSFLYSPHEDASAGDGMTNRGAPSLFIDPASISPLWIAYEAIDPLYDPTLKVIVVRKKDGATWQTTKELKYPIASSGVSYTNPSISGAGANVSVTFQSNNNDVYVARYDGSTWNEPSLKEYGVINPSISTTKNPGTYSDNCILSTNASGPPHAIQPLTRPGTPTAPKVLAVAGSDGIYHPRLSWNIFYEPNLQSHKIYRRYYYATTGENTNWVLCATLGSTASSWTDMGVEQYVPDPHQPALETDQAEYYIQAVNTLGITSYESGHVVADIILQETQKRGTPNRPVKFALDANFPNPFNPSTTIKYAVPEEVLVSLKVYDVLGREVATLVDEFKYADFYEVTFNASNLPTGMYYYRLTAGKFTQVKKMLLAK